MRNGTFSTAVDVLLAVSALSVVGLVALRGRDRSTAEAKLGLQDSISASDWDFAKSLGTQVGSPGGELELVEFLDLQCAGCAQYDDEVLSQLIEAGPERGASIFIVHFPLKSHPFAREAAIAAECAGREGKFRDFTRLALRRQASLPMRQWSSLAAEAGVADTTSFTSCLVDATVAAHVDSSRAFGDRLGVTATPTIVVNGVKFSQPPSLSLIQSTAASRNARANAP